jgi:hypothetical protein
MEAHLRAEGDRFTRNRHRTDEHVSVHGHDTHGPFLYAVHPCDRIARTHESTIPETLDRTGGGLSERDQDLLVGPVQRQADVK